MLNDTDKWPVICPNCGYETKKQIGWLKHAVNVTCDRCGETRGFYNQAFVQSLDNLRQHIDVFARNSPFTEKKS